MIPVDSVKKLLENGLPGANVTVQDMTGTGDHFEIVIISNSFESKNTLARQRLVYGVLSNHLNDGTIHAVTLKTMTPQELGELK